MVECTDAKFAVLWTVAHVLVVIHAVLWAWLVAARPAAF